MIERNFKSTFAKNKIEETISFKLNIGSKGKIRRIKIQSKKYRVFQKRDLYIMVLKNLSHPILLKKTPFQSSEEKVFGKPPDLTPPPVSQSDPRSGSPDFTFRTYDLPRKFELSPGNENQSDLTLPQKVTNQMSLNPETPVFRIFHVRIPYISNVTQDSGLLSLAAASVTVGAPAQAW